MPSIVGATLVGAQHADRPAATRRVAAARSKAERDAQPGAAAFAASIARGASARVPSATDPITSPRRSRVPVAADAPPRRSTGERVGIAPASDGPRSRR